MKKRIRAIIIEAGKLLLIHRKKLASGEKKAQEYWVFPGGGQDEIDHNDDIATLLRESREELGVDVRVGRLFDTVVRNDEEEKFYFCVITAGDLGTGKGPEFQDPTGKGEYILEWLTREEVAVREIFPETIKNKLLSEGVL